MSRDKSRPRGVGRAGFSSTAPHVASVLALLLACHGLAGAQSVVAQGAGTAQEAGATSVDPYVSRQRVVVLTDIANEPDDQMSMVRLLVYSNQLEIEGLIATTSTWLKNRVRPDVIRILIDAYEEVRPNLLEHQSGFPTADALR